MTRRSSDLYAGSEIGELLDKARQLPRRLRAGFVRWAFPWGRRHDAGRHDGPEQWQLEQQERISQGDPRRRRRGLRGPRKTWLRATASAKRRGVLGHPVGHQHERRHARRRDGEHGRDAAAHEDDGRNSASGTSYSSRASCSRSPPRPSSSPATPTGRRRGASTRSRGRRNARAAFAGLHQPGQARRDLRRGLRAIETT